MGALLGSDPTHSLFVTDRGQIQGARRAFRSEVAARLWVDPVSLLLSRHGDGGGKRKLPPPPEEPAPYLGTRESKGAFVNLGNAAD
jgi:hypothetical protein